MTTLLKQLKTKYPKARLTASLVSIHENQYIVRAAISQDGDEIATGLAASVDVQIAEDKARQRAIAILGLEEVESTATAKPPAPKPPTPKSSTPKSPKPKSISTPADEPVSVETLELDQAPGSEQAPLTEIPPEEDDLGPPIDAVKEEALPPAEMSASSATSSATHPSAAAIALENFNTSATPVDLSDVIAQTDVELTRLGWTSDQGREYLEKTYGKRSRQQLTDEELMSFLLYLEDIA